MILKTVVFRNRNESYRIYTHNRLLFDPRQAFKIMKLIMQYNIVILLAIVLYILIIV